MMAGMGWLRAEHAGLWLLGGLAAFAAFAFLARRHAFVSLLLGLALIAVPVVQAFTFDRDAFQSEGSAAGLVIFLAYAGVGLACGVAGLVFAMRGTMGLLEARIASRPVRFTVALVAIPAMIVVGVQAFAYGSFLAGFMGSSIPERKIARPDQELRRQVEVKDAYLLKWQRRDRAPALAMRIPAADFRVGAEPVRETSDGPNLVELHLVEADAPLAELLYYRDDSRIEDRVYDGLRKRASSDAAAPPQALWIVEDQQGGARLAGFACGPAFVDAHCFVPEAPAARYLPNLLGYDNPRLFAFEEATVGSDGRRAERCSLAFRYRGRIAIASLQEGCFRKGTFETLRAAVALLGRFEHDAEVAPAPAARLARAREASARCTQLERASAGSRPNGLESPTLRARRELACRHALQLAVAELADSPVEASGLVLATMESAPHSGSIWRSRSLDAVFAALERAGAPARRQLLHAHVVRTREPVPAARAPLQRASAQALLRDGASLAADDPLFPAVFEALDRMPVDDEDMRARRVSLLGELSDKAWAARPASDLAWNMRFESCRQRASDAIEREKLRACAKDLLAEWRKRASGGASFEAFHSEPDLAMAVAIMYLGYAAGTQDRASAEQGLRRVRDLAGERFGGDPRLADLVAQLGRMSASLATPSAHGRRDRGAGG